jgi:potassium uptake TrkH family protein
LEANFLNNFITRVGPSVGRIPFLLSLFTVLVVILDIGFNQNHYFQGLIHQLYTITFCVAILATIGRYIFQFKRFRPGVLLFDGCSVILFSILIYLELDETVTANFLLYFDNKFWFFSALILVFIREASNFRINLSRAVVNPAQLFILSFLSIILLGALLLMVPNATQNGISFIDAIFTSTSAVCVTGLIVVDTGTYFTFFGQIIILVLIQLGGLGIMTFAMYFSYFFSGGTSYENQLMLSDMTSSNKLGEVFNTLKKIILVTFSIEALGAVLIFGSIKDIQFGDYFDQTFFSIFHSVSAFCNAGFSTLGDGLFETGFRYNYSLQLIILILFVIGGLGFPIVFNIFNYITYLFKNRFFPFIINQPKKKVVTPWVINLNSRIVLITTTILLVIGTLAVLGFEYNNALNNHPWYGKVLNAMFTAATPRTAGFNTVDFAGLRFSTLMLIFLLMWIGAAPASTGGGIKISTFAIATLNFWSLARGKERIEIFRRQIADVSIRRAFGIISLSLIVIGTGVFFIALFDDSKELLEIAFECFSAYSTVGLSLGITPDLNIPSKIVIILVMFIGRVSALSILIAIVKKVKHKNYRYPGEEILIN